MTDLDYLSKLLLLLKSNSILSYKDSSLEILLHVEQRQADVDVGDHGKAISQDYASHTEHHQDESQLPVDLRSDALADHDKILFYSGSPDPNESPLPGTGEADL